MLLNQDLFRQKASNPQSSLQPWLEQLLNAPGLVRCYATEDSNPTKQLKNKLSQAAAAREGLLVLLLADDGAYSKAREALLERWMSNDEWPKSVAAVALAHPLSNAAIATIIQRTKNAWSSRIRFHCFPQAELITVADQDETSVGVRCSDCGHMLPSEARFCSGCGNRVNISVDVSSTKSTSTT